MSYEKITVTGHIGNTEVLKSGAGNAYIRMTVAVERGRGENRKTIWYSVLMFGNYASTPEKTAALYAKGRHVLVEGRPQTELFVRKDGSPGLDHSIIVTQFPELLDNKPKS